MLGIRMEVMYIDIYVIPTYWYMLFRFIVVCSMLPRLYVNSMVLEFESLITQ